MSMHDDPTPLEDGEAYTTPPPAKRVVCWFSCGAPSAVAAKLAIRYHGHDNLVVVYEDTGSEHHDNVRFREEVEEWLEHPVEVIRSDKYKDIWEVFEKTRYLVGPGGARCTAELKRKVAERYINHFCDREVFGYSIEEAKRVERFRANNPERDLWPILIERNLSKADCLGIIDRAGIEIPAMYKLGFQNNNCIGCVKGQSGYWNRIRKHFPEVFERMAKVERDLDVAICKSYAGDGERKRVFLDELDPEAGRGLPEPSISCGLFCMQESLELEQPEVEDCEE